MHRWGLKLVLLTFVLILKTSNAAKLPVQYSLPSRPFAIEPSENDFNKAHQFPAATQPLSTFIRDANSQQDVGIDLDGGDGQYLPPEIDFEPQDSQNKPFACNPVVNIPTFTTTVESTHVFEKLKHVTVTTSSYEAKTQNVVKTVTKIQTLTETQLIEENVPIISTKIVDVTRTRSLAPFTIVSTYTSTFVTQTTSIFTSVITSKATIFDTTTKTVANTQTQVSIEEIPITDTTIYTLPASTRSTTRQVTDFTTKTTSLIPYTIVRTTLVPQIELITIEKTAPKQIVTSYHTSTSQINAYRTSEARITVTTTENFYFKAPSTIYTTKDVYNTGTFTETQTEILTTTQTMNTIITKTESSASYITSIHTVTKYPDPVIVTETSTTTLYSDFPQGRAAYQNIVITPTVISTSTVTPSCFV